MDTADTTIKVTEPTEITLDIRGYEVLVQVNPDTGSLEICFSEPLPATNWGDDDGKPAPISDAGFDAGEEHTRLSQMISIALPEEVREPEDTDWIEFYGDRWESLTVRKEGKGVTLSRGTRKEWIVFESHDDAEAACRAHYKDMALHSPEEFKCLAGPDRVMEWGLGNGSMDDWLDDVANECASYWASYDGESIEGIEIGAELEEEIGFKPAVAYCRNF